MGKNLVTNTTKVADEDPLSVLAEAAVLGPSGAIEFSEARGQAQFVGSEVLPRDVRCSEVVVDGKALLARWGFKFGEPVEGDGLFQHAELPAGWAKRPREHAMWSEVVDGAGRVRCTVFYKAAFYDRRAHLRIVSRYSVEGEFHGEGDGKLVRGVAKEGEAVLYATEWEKDVVETGEETPYWRLQEVAKGWLNKHVPDWGDPGAHWDRP